jgi:hypothetical protein
LHVEIKDVPITILEARDCTKPPTPVTKNQGIPTGPPPTPAVIRDGAASSLSASFALFVALLLLALN